MVPGTKSWCLLLPWLHSYLRKAEQAAADGVSELISKHNIILQCRLVKPSVLAAFVVLYHIVKNFKIDEWVYGPYLLVNTVLYTYPVHDLRYGTYIHMCLPSTCLPPTYPHTIASPHTHPPTVGQASDERTRDMDRRCSHIVVE